MQSRTGILPVTLRSTGDPQNLIQVMLAKGKLNEAVSFSCLDGWDNETAFLFVATSVSERIQIVRVRGNRGSQS